MPDFALGQRVRFDHHLVRQREWHPPNRTERWWHPTPTLWMNGAQHDIARHPMEGIVVGLRRLQDVTVAMRTIGSLWDSYDEEADVRVKKSHAAALIAYDLRRAPIYALVKHVHPIDPQPETD